MSTHPPKLAPRREIAKCPTGILGLDQITEGGLPKGRPTLICGSAGCGKTVLPMEFLVRHVKRNEPDMTATNRKNGKAKHKSSGKVWNLRLYIAGESSRSIAAMSNLHKICNEHLPGKYRVEVVDLLKNPQLAAGDQIVAGPTLVRRLPPPLKKIIGDLSNSQQVIVGLDLRPRPTS
jgi:circadian clock protein KaiB